MLIENKRPGNRYFNLVFIENNQIFTHFKSKQSKVGIVCLCRTRYQLFTFLAVKLKFNVKINFRFGLVLLFFY